MNKNTIHTDLIRITHNSGAVSALYMITESGWIIYRDKVDTIIGIKHPGIVLGQDTWGTVWVIHNHYQIGHPQVVTLNEFTDGGEIFYDNRPVFYDTMTILRRSLVHWHEKREYSWLLHNCQHFVNKVVHGESKSEAIDKVTDIAMVVGGITSLIGFFTGNRALVNTGLGIAAGGAIGKRLSRI